jgi:Tol biopolymer transport system component
MNRNFAIITFFLSMVTPLFCGELAGYKVLWISFRTGDTELYVVDGTTGNLTNLSNSPNSSERYPSWSWDGRKIAFNSDRDGAQNLYVMDADGKNLLQLTHETKPAQAGMQSWTGDGSWIYFGIFGKGAPQMWRIHPDGSGSEMIGTGIDAAVSPDGKMIAYAKNDQQGHYLYAADADGKHERQLTTIPNAYDGVHAAWTPDSKHIVYGDRVGDAEELFMSDPDGSNRKQLTFLKHAATSPTVSPDGKWITFRLCDEVYWKDKEASKRAYAERRSDKRPVWIMGIDGSNPHVVELMHWDTTIDGSRAPITLSR